MKLSIVESPAGGDAVYLLIAEESDLPEIVTLVNSAYRGESSRAGWTTEADHLDGQRTDLETLRADLAARPGAVVLMLRESVDGPLLASAWLEPAEGDAWYTGMLTVRPDLQAKQLGRTLLAEAERYARTHRARRMRLTVVNVRGRLISWYERRGYKLTGEEQPFPYGDSRFGIPRRDDLRFLVLEKTLEPEVVRR